MWKSLRKWHIRIVLQNGERMYLNLLQSGSEQRSSINAQAAAKLGRKDAGERSMLLVGVDGREISILVDTVSVIDRVVPGRPLLTSRDQPDMILSEEDARYINKMLLTGWKTDDDHLKGWASQGARTGRVAQGIRGEQPGERPEGWALGKTLQVKVGNCITDTSALFDQSVPDTVVRYRVAAGAGLKAGGLGRWLPSMDEEAEFSSCEYTVLVLNWKGQTQLIVARGVGYTAFIRDKDASDEIWRTFPGVSMGTSRVL